MTTCPPTAFALNVGATRWIAIDDVVMGGVSASRAAITYEGTLVFSGTVSLDRGGGFASIRSAPGHHDLGRCSGIVVRVKGDGKTYRLNLKPDAGLDGVQYQATFTPDAGTWQDIALPWSAFEPRSRGRPRRDAPSLDPSRIATFGFLIADRQAGPFHLEVAGLRGIP